MRNFLRVSAAVVALLVATNVAGAQGGGGGGGGGARGGGRGGAGQVTRLMANITLSEAQKAKSDSVVMWFDAESAKLPAMGGRGGGDTPPDTAAMNAARAARTKLQGEFRDKLKALLTPEQQKTFDENVAAMPAGGRGRGGH